MTVGGAPIDLGWSSAAIARALGDVHIDYCWRLDPEETKHVITMPDPRHPIDHSPGAFAQVRGRGKGSSALDASPIVVEGVRWWFNNLRWSAHWSCRPPHRRSHEYTSSFLELLIDVELAIGLELPGSDWLDKSKRLASLLRNMARIYTVQVDGATVSWKEALDPHSSLPPSPPWMPLAFPESRGGPGG